MAAFAAERSWQQFHTPRNLVLALVGEVGACAGILVVRSASIPQLATKQPTAMPTCTGELAECFQWKGEVQPQLPGWSETEVRAHALVHCPTAA
jgi:hypothetical protein